MKRFTLLIAALATIVGCTAVPPEQPGKAEPKVSLGTQATASVTVFVLEPSGDTAQDARSLEFFDRVARKYCTSEGSDTTTIILARATNPPTVTSMSATEFKKRYDTPEAMKALMAKTGTGSRIYDTICEAVREAKPLMNDKTRSAMFVLSPMVDTYSPPPNPMGAALRHLVEFDRKNGAIAFFGVERREAHHLRLTLDGMLRNYIVASASEANWPLPEWK